MNVGILTTGVICPGVNTVITEITHRERLRGNKVHGYPDGWYGLNHDIRDPLVHEDLSYEAGSALYTSDESALDLDFASKHIRKLDKLYTISDFENFEGSRKVVEHFRNDTNVICIAKSLERDVSFGFQTVVNEYKHVIARAKAHAKTTKRVAYVEIDGCEMARRVACTCSHMVDAVITPETPENQQFDVEHAFAMNSHAVVITDTASCTERLFIMGDMKRNFGIESDVFRPGVLCQYVPPCPYDSFLSSKMAREVVDMSTQKRNFVKIVNQIKFL